MSFFEQFSRAWDELTSEQKKRRLSALFPGQSPDLIKFWTKIKSFDNLPAYVANALLKNEGTHSDNDVDNFDLS